MKLGPTRESAALYRFRYGLQVFVQWAFEDRVCNDGRDVGLLRPQCD
jgi:hypothetical protein